jgi:hypothetical protein
MRKYSILAGQGSKPILRSKSLVLVTISIVLVALPLPYWLSHDPDAQKLTNSKTMHVTQPAPNAQEQDSSSTQQPLVESDTVQKESMNNSVTSSQNSPQAPVTPPKPTVIYTHKGTGTTANSLSFTPPESGWKVNYSYRNCVSNDSAITDGIILFLKIGVSAPSKQAPGVSGSGMWGSFLGRKSPMYLRVAAPSQCNWQITVVQ